MRYAHVKFISNVFVRMCGREKRPRFHLGGRVSLGRTFTSCNVVVCRRHHACARVNKRRHQNGYVSRRLYYGDKENCVHVEIALVLRRIYTKEYSQHILQLTTTMLYFVWLGKSNCNTLIILAGRKFRFVTRKTHQTDRGDGGGGVERIGQESEDFRSESSAAFTAAGRLYCTLRSSCERAGAHGGRSENVASWKAVMMSHRITMNHSQSKANAPGRFHIQLVLAGAPVGVCLSPTAI